MQLEKGIPLVKHVQKNEGSILIDLSIIMPICIAGVLILTRWTVDYHDVLISDLYKNVQEYYGQNIFSATEELEQRHGKVYVETSEENKRIQQIHTIKFMDDVTEQIEITRETKEKYKETLEKIQDILE